MTPSPRQTPRIGVAGIGGFAATHHRALLALEQRGACRVVCACDPRADVLADLCAEWRFAGRGVRVFGDFARMLGGCDGSLDYVVISTPIPLHAPMHAEAVAAGIPVYLEKPPTLDPAELERMLAVEERARAATLVAFHYAPERARRALKGRLVSGEFGSVRRVLLLGFSPRPRSYFERTGWAGRLRRDDGRLVLDSCLGNALAHSVHNLLHWAGVHEVDAIEAPAEVRASLHRAHAIEGADTFFVQARLASGVEARIAVTHAGSGPARHEEIVECERATLVCVPAKSFEVRWRDGRVERIAADGYDGVTENHLAYLGYLRGERARPPATLADSRAFVELQALAHVAAEAIRPLRAEWVTTRDGKSEQVFADAPGLAPWMGDFLERGRWPAGAPTRVATTADAGALAEAVDRLSGGR